MTGKAIGRAVVLAFVLAAALVQPPRDADARVLSGTVVRVTDGDTLAVADRGGGRVTVRLYGIDAPEIRHRDRPGQAFGREARQALKSMTLGRTVRVDVVDVDTHRRSVGVVTVRGVDVNLAMVSAGFAWAYRRHLSAPYASEYLRAEKEARAKRLGLWRDANPLPPWEFRKRTRRAR